MKKKIYEQPKTEVVKIEHAEVICASTGFNSGNMLINGGNDLTFDEEDF